MMSLAKVQPVKVISMALAAMLGMVSQPSLAWTNNNDDGDCSLYESWELGHMVIISKSTDLGGEDLMSDSVSISVFNNDWSISSDDKPDYTLKYIAPDGGWFSNEPYALPNGLLIYVKMKHIEDIRSASYIEIFKDDERIAQLDWDISPYEFYKFKQCITDARAPIVERERLERLRQATPRDPFAKAEDANREQAEPK